MTEENPKSKIVREALERLMIEDPKSASKIIWGALEQEQKVHKAAVKTICEALEPLGKETRQSVLISVTVSLAASDAPAVGSLTTLD